MNRPAWCSNRWGDTGRPDKNKGVYRVFSERKWEIKMKAGDRALWHPDLSDLIFEIKIPPSIDYVMTILKIDPTVFAPGSR